MPGEKNNFVPKPAQQDFATISPATSSTNSSSRLLARDSFIHTLYETSHTRSNRLHLLRDLNLSVHTDKTRATCLTEAVLTAAAAAAEAEAIPTGTIDIQAAITTTVAIPAGMKTLRSRYCLSESKASGVLLLVASAFVDKTRKRF